MLIAVSILYISTLVTWRVHELHKTFTYLFMTMLTHILTCKYTIHTHGKFIIPVWPKKKQHCSCQLSYYLHNIISSFRVLLYGENNFILKQMNKMAGLFQVNRVVCLFQNTCTIFKSVRTKNVPPYLSIDFFYYFSLPD